MKITVHKTILTLFTFFIFFNMKGYSQTLKHYEKEWKRVEDLINQGLPASALIEVKKIYASAKKDNQDAQVIKAAIYKCSLQSETREDDIIESIKELDSEIAVAKEPVAGLLKSFQAELFYGYFQQNRWKLYNRTNTIDFIKEDIATWTLEDFHIKISSLYLQSVEAEKILQQTKLEPFDVLIQKGNMRKLRPTLYDLLAHRAISYFENDERDIKKVTYSFEVNQSTAFSKASVFVKEDFSTKDSLSLQQKALILYQKLIAFHLNDKNPDALIDADVLRIQFAKEKSTHPDKEQLYFNAISQIAHQYEQLPAAAQAWFLIAQHHDEKAGKYSPFGDSSNRFDKLKAKGICEQVVAQKEESEGKAGCRNLLQTLLQPSLTFFVEQVNIPNQPFRVLLQYQNFNTLYLKIVKVDSKLKALIEKGYDETYWPSLINTTAERSWQQQLPATNDMQQHAVEIKVDPLPVGEYILLAGANKNFADIKTELGARSFHVSSISHINNADDYFVLDRNNGQPLAQAAVQIWEQRYDYNKNAYIREKKKKYVTDANGFFKLDAAPPKETYGNNIFLDIAYKTDQLFLNNAQYRYHTRSAQPEASKAKIFLFTDRSIYRPGQTVFFKGIAIVQNSFEKKNSIATSSSFSLFLSDANGKRIDTIKVTTNEYGSFSGKFQLPASRLNGSFNLIEKNNNGSVSFKMEEYKRPKFFVDYEPIKVAYKVNDKIKLTGVAKAYAGNNIDGAIVKYRVLRQPRFIYPWYWKGWLPPVSEMEIAHGEIKTDKDGKFIVDFVAIPDLSIDKKSDPVFDYTIYADVTDINGETRSGKQKISVSYKDLMLVSKIPASISVDDFKTLNIRTENINGAFLPATVKVIISKLQAEKRLIRNRYWQRPDQFVMSQADYIRSFPNDEYDNETEQSSWAKEKIVFEKEAALIENSDFQISSDKLTQGYYIVEMSAKNKDGETITDKKYVLLTDEKTNQSYRSEYLWAKNSDPIEPGQSANISLGTTADNLFLIQNVKKSSATNNYSFIKFSNEIKNLYFPASDADRGGFSVNLLFVKNNRFYQHSETVQVPWSNKDLQIEYASYRDRTLPGSEEKWKIKISGYKNEKVAAEVLASMYDASLDQFYAHKWSKPDIWPNYYSNGYWGSSENFSQATSSNRDRLYIELGGFEKNYDELFVNIYDEAPMPIGLGGRRSDMMMMRVRGASAMESEAKGAPPKMMKNESDGLADSVSANNEVANNDTAKEKNEQTPQQGTEVQIRKNFNETAFFFPELSTDTSGNIEFSFTTPDALTKWKFQALAHTKEAAFGYSSKDIITQKDLMVQPNAPRFLREGDKMEFSAKVVNLTEKELTGQAELQLIDATTNSPIDGWFKNIIPNQYFTVAAGQSEPLKFPIEVPYQFSSALQWRIIVKSGKFSDGEESYLPVLTNRMLVTESLPLNMNGIGSKNFVFNNLANASNSKSLQHKSLTVEYTSNPVWYAVQALPYLMEYPYDCAEQTWSRYYANSLATFVANASPKIKAVFERWKIMDTAALLSNLQKNQELKAVLLEETPWVLAAEKESEQKKRIALLFDMLKMSEQLTTSYDKLKQMQSSNGGFVWFKGGPDDRYMTQYIITGIGHLKKLNAVVKGQTGALNAILKTAIPYLDKKIKADYDLLIKHKTDLKKYTPDYTVVQYLYMRSFFPEYATDKNSTVAYNYFRERAQKTWVSQSKYMQGMIALSLYRTTDAITPKAILNSLKETSISNEELGMYWKDNSTGGWFWYQAPIESQALLIEAFQEIAKDNKTVNALRTWLLKNKQTNNWKTTKATAEACYALLLQGQGTVAAEELTSEPKISVQMGKTTINSFENKQEAGTGYFKTTIEGSKVNAAMGNITVNVSDPTRQFNKEIMSTTWGSVYWQYFEDLDKIKTAATPLKLIKKLFVEKNTDRGPALTPVNDAAVLKVGDKIKVRIELRVDRDMEYVHMKDMRASALEPTNVLSGYKWQAGLGYYESTKDASTNFFFGQLRKGTYVFEYSLFLTHGGNFSNGITSIQCMYAPEFSSHSEGIRIVVE